MTSRDLASFVAFVVVTTSYRTFEDCQIVGNWTLDYLCTKDEMFESALWTSSRRKPATRWTSQRHMRGHRPLALHRASTAPFFNNRERSDVLKLVPMHDSALNQYIYV
jgi:hypothetical protein